MSTLSNTILATSVFLTTFAGLGAGYMMAPPPERTGDSRPIVDPEAWNRSAPGHAPFETGAQMQNVAINASVDNLNQQGWVPPEGANQTSYQDASYHEASYQDDDLSPDASDKVENASYAIEPLEGAGSSDKGSTVIAVLNNAEADRAWDSAPTSNVSEQTTTTPDAPTSP